MFKRLMVAAVVGLTLLGTAIRHVRLGGHTAPLRERVMTEDMRAAEEGARGTPEGERESPTRGNR